MSLAGVRSNRGDAYQTAIGFEWALRILLGDQFEWIELDSTSPDSTGLAYVVDDVVIGAANGSIVCCQCKKNQVNFDSWDFNDLKDELGKALAQLSRDSSATVVFYSQTPFGELQKLGEYARAQ